MEFCWPKKRLLLGGSTALGSIRVGLDSSFSADLGEMGECGGVCSSVG